MSAALHLFLTGFGAFLDVERNPSEEVIHGLEREGVEGVRITSSILPVTFDGAPRVLKEAVAELGGDRPDFLLSLGAQREGYYRLERNAMARLVSKKPDLDGRYARDVETLRGGNRTCGFDLEPLAEALRTVEDAAEVRISDHAGGYVCERTYHALLGIGEELDLPALFLHLPPLHAVGADRQLAHLRHLIAFLRDR